MKIRVIKSTQDNNAIISTNCGIMTDSDKHHTQLFLNNESSDWQDILNDGVILLITSYDEEQRTIIHGIIRVVDNPIDLEKYNHVVQQRNYHEITHVLIDERLAKYEEFEHYYSILFNYILSISDKSMEHCIWMDFKNQLYSKLLEVPFLNCNEYRYEPETKYFANKTIEVITQQVDIEKRILKDFKKSLSFL